MLYQDLADAVLSYRVANSKTLTLEQKNSLNLAFGQLLNASEGFADQALSQALVDIETSVKNLQVAAHDAIDALQTLTKLKNVLDIAASAVGLASASSTHSGHRHIGYQRPGAGCSGSQGLGVRSRIHVHQNI